MYLYIIIITNNLKLSKMEAYKSKTTKTQRYLIKDFIQVELLKRGFYAPIISFNELPNRFEFQTKEFQTTPVIFKTIKIAQFNSYIIAEDFKNNDTAYSYYRFSIAVNISYEHFTGGSNGAELFTVYGELADEGVFNLRVQ